MCTATSVETLTARRTASAAVLDVGGRGLAVAEAGGFGDGDGRQAEAGHRLLCVQQGEEF